MRGHGRALLLLAPTLAALAAVPAMAQTEQAKPAKPTLRAASLNPLTIQGLRFKPNERVSVSVVTGGRSDAKVVVASDAGSFTARFGLSVGRCGRYAVRAFGARGSSARLVPRGDWPDCVGDDAAPRGDDLPTLDRVHQR